MKKTIIYVFVFVLFASLFLFSMSTNAYARTRHASHSRHITHHSTYHSIKFHHNTVKIKYIHHHSTRRNHIGHYHATPHRSISHHRLTTHGITHHRSLLNSKIHIKSPKLYIPKIHVHKLKVPKLKIKVYHPKKVHTSGKGIAIPSYVIAQYNTTDPTSTQAQTSAPATQPSKPTYIITIKNSQDAINFADKLFSADIQRDPDFHVDLSRTYTDNGHTVYSIHAYDSVPATAYAKAYQVTIEWLGVRDDGAYRNTMLPYDNWFNTPQ